MFSLRRSILYQLAAGVFALIALFCALNWMIGGYVAMQRAADLKLTLTEMLPGSDRPISAIVRIFPASFDATERTLDAYALDATSISVARVVVPEGFAVPAEDWTRRGDGTALVRMTVWRDEETGSLVLDEPGFQSQASDWSIFTGIGLTAAIINGTVAVVLIILSVQASAVPSQAPSHRPSNARPRSAKSVRAARRFAALEAQDRLNTTSSKV
ncbi:hypothetical protein PARPLA_02089 [Rhodobacteraceae bacterium THAF1]|uniref:hypothetical protein n=1 Tax=Palleronia sp. THAF1 TaxID=2587842 RepID=UPI000F41EFCD|nr:hypothetical protein [Palleronia sp. THAF1]QFU07802.1 hypothetical protein FIU81_03845 [Palleronia sp. THAF1]VDC25617.1 hypothetical protein PARPLA_02089 [Rhodobacteraceae bacterium THAF1]